MLAAVHIGATLYHHFDHRDGTLHRMLGADLVSKKWGLNSRNLR